MKARTATLLAVCLALALPLSALARGNWHGGGGWHGRPGFHHHFHPGPVIGFGIVGAPYWFYPDYAPYLYAVPAAPQQPPVYIEQFIGEPSPGMTGIVCPSQNLAPYPQVLSCPGGWARVLAGPKPG